MQSAEGKGQNEERGRVTSDNLAVPATGPQPWMLELAKMLILKDLPTGVIVGTAVISECRARNDSEHATLNTQHATLNVEGKAELETVNSQLPTTHLFEWHLTEVERVKRVRKPKGHPQPVWFTPF